MVRLTKPKNFFPIGGNYRHQDQYRKMTVDLGYTPEHTFIPGNGEPLLITNHAVKYGEKIDLKNIYVDGLGIGDVGKVVLRDRRVMAADGIVVVIVPVEQSTSKISGNVEIVTRGFVYVKESAELIEQIKAQVNLSLKDQKGFVTDWGYLRRKLEDSLEKFLYEKTERNPLIMPVIVEV